MWIRGDGSCGWYVDLENCRLVFLDFCFEEFFFVLVVEVVLLIFYGIDEGEVMIVGDFFDWEVFWFWC